MAVDAPRWLLGRTWGSTSTSLKMENRFDPSIMAGLARLGHEVEEIGQAYSDGLGHAGMLVKHPRDGRVEATHDPRSDGGAMGLVTEATGFQSGAKLALLRLHPAGIRTR